MVSVQLPLWQLWQAPQAAEVQQKPPVQLPLRHWSPLEQAVPLAALAKQLPPLQKLAVAQSASPLQLVGQEAAEPLQAKGAQDGVPGPATFAQLPVAQLWQAPHEDELQHEPPTQLPLKH